MTNPITDLCKMVDKTTISTQHKKPSSFFDLPNEIRNIIYHYALVQTRPIVVLHNPQQLSWNLDEKPALLRTRLEICIQASPIFYGNNVFQSVCRLSTESWLSQLSPSSIDCIHQFWIDGHLAGEGKSTTVYEMLEYINYISRLGKGMLWPEALMVPVRVVRQRAFSTYDDVFWAEFWELLDFEVVEDEDGAWQIVLSEHYSRTGNAAGMPVEIWDVQETRRDEGRTFV